MWSEVCYVYVDGYMNFQLQKQLYGSFGHSNQKKKMYENYLLFKFVENYVTKLLGFWR